jgi:adenylate cyclase
MVKGGDLFGEGVNIAARLQAIAEPGGVCVSGDAHRHVRKTLSLHFTDVGAQQVKNIAEPVSAYRVNAGPLGAEPQTLSTPLPLPDKPSIAVLPFANLSGDAEQEYFADGITEDLLTALSRLRWLFVIARNSSFMFKGRAVDVKEVGRQLGVRYVLEGSIRKAGNRVRITGQLIEAATGAHIWAERYDRDLTDIFELQDEITGSVVSAVEPNLLSVETARARAKPTESLAAYDLYLRALPEFHAMTEAGFRRAERLLTEAVQRDPQFSEAWAALADCTARMATLGWIANWELASDTCCYAARTAVEADYENGASLATAAFALALMGGKLDEAMELAEKAIHLHPNSAGVCTNCGWVLILNGAYDRAIQLLEAARRMSPLDPRGYLSGDALAAAYLFSMRLEQADFWTRWALSRWPSNAPSLRLRAAVLVQLGRSEDARRAVSDLLKVQPNASVSRSRRLRYRDTETYERFLECLRLAGLPE